MHIQSSRFKFLSTALALLLAISPEMLAQQSGAQQQQQNGQAAQTSAPAQTPGQGTAVNPSQPPLQPVTTYPSASDNTDQQQAAPADNNQAQSAPEAPQPKAQQQQPSQPVGAATAERVPTAGGAAAKPAGAAIAPAKQHQTRSLLIKIGAIAAAGVAAGTIYALSRGTSSTPPNAVAGVPK